MKSTFEPVPGGEMRQLASDIVMQVIAALADNIEEEAARMYHHRDEVNVDYLAGFEAAAAYLRRFGRSRSVPKGEGDG